MRLQLSKLNEDEKNQEITQNNKPSEDEKHQEIAQNNKLNEDEKNQEIIQNNKPSEDEKHQDIGQNNKPNEDEKHQEIIQNNKSNEDEKHQETTQNNKSNEDEKHQETTQNNNPSEDEKHQEITQNSKPNEDDGIKEKENSTKEQNKTNEKNDDFNQNNNQLITNKNIQKIDKQNQDEYQSHSYENPKSIRESPSLYLRWLVKISDERHLHYNDIPNEFIDYFTLPGLSQALNISINEIPPIDWSKVENYINNNTFSNFKSLAEGIRDNFNTDFEKLYASYYFITHNIAYDYQRMITCFKKELSIDEIFNNKKGICSDYSKLQRELTKRSGVKTKNIPIFSFANASKGSGWNSFNPLQNPDFDHEANIIKINNEYFVSEPTWGSGKCDTNNEFHFNYVKSCFLIPYYKILATHFPEKIIDESLNISFSYEQFKALNKPNFLKELSFESNPFQKITVDDSFYEYQFSFIQPVESISANLYKLNDYWLLQNETYITFECLAKNLPSHRFSLSASELRCRYKMTVYFQEIGEYKVEVFLNTKQMFHVYFDVTKINKKRIGIYGKNKEKYSYIPIVPLDGLTEVTNGIARIRFAIKYENSLLLIKLYKIQNDTFERESEIECEKFIDVFSTELPFKHSNDLFLVEDWILVQFEECGRYEVEVYFKNDEESYTFGVKYYFDVTQINNDDISPLFDLPKNRKFAPFQLKTKSKTGFKSITPSTQAVVIDDMDFYFNILSENKFNLHFKSKNNEIVWPSLISTNENDNCTDYEYSVTFPKNGVYELLIFEDGKYIGSQIYYIVDNEEFQEESEKEKKLMDELKSKIDNKYDYYKDIPINIRENIEKMIENVHK